MDKPEWYSNLKKWRTANGLTGEAWNLYVEAINERLLLISMLTFVIGLAVGSKI